MPFRDGVRRRLSSSPTFERCFAAARTFILITGLSVLVVAGDDQVLRNGGFETPSPAEFWQLSSSKENQKFSITADATDLKEGKQSLLISADQAGEVSLYQEAFLPVGTLWRLSGWVKSAASSDLGDANSGPQIGIETPSGDQGFSPANPAREDWQSQTVLFRVPSPGRVRVSLRALIHQAGKVWLDDIRLTQVPEPLTQETVTISGRPLGKRRIDLKQGGQFIEPLCNLLPSMIAQQVVSTSFEEESPWTVSYKQEIDKPHRAWYPDGSVHLATYSYDTNNPFNGKRSQKIELPSGNTWAGISQDGFYLEAQHSYRLRLHLRSQGDLRIRVSLHGDGGTIAGPVSLGSGSPDWRAADVVLQAKRTAQNATLTVEFEGSGTLWLDRVYLIDQNAVLGLWRPDVVAALKALKPGIVRFGGSTIEFFDWQKTIGNWDKREPFPDDPWGGLQENFAGLEEFVQLTRYIGAEPLICVRWSGKTPRDAAREVEYFNGSITTEWGRLRAQNGHPAPYNVKYWQVGNEVSGPEYDASLEAFAKAMRETDPSIKVLSSLPTADTLRVSHAAPDYLSPHLYSVGDLNGTEDRLKELRSEIQKDGNGKDIRVAVTEWNVTGEEFGLRRGMLLTLGNALSLSRFQNMMHRYSDWIEIANRSNLSDSFGSGVLVPGPGSLYRTPSYYSQQLYQRAAGSIPLKIERNSPLPLYAHEPDLDATLTPDGKTLRLYGVNSTSEPRAVRFELGPDLGSVESGKIFVLRDRDQQPDSEAMNSRDDPERVVVRTASTSLNGPGFAYQFPPFAVTLLELRLRKSMAVPAGKIQAQTNGARVQAVGSGP